MFSFLSLYLNYFSFIPVCTSFELKLFDRFSEEISVEHASKFTTQNQYLISGLLWLTFLHVHSDSLCSPLFHGPGVPPVGIIKSYFIVSNLFSLSLPSQSFYQFGGSVKPHCVSFLLSSLTDFYL